MQKNTLKTCPIQFKEWCFVVFDNDSYNEKIDRQLERSYFQRLDYNPSDKLHKKVTSWVKKWKQNKVLDNSWSRFIETSDVNPRKMCGLIKTHKVGNPVRVMTSGCGTAMEKISILVEKCLYLEVLNI